MRQEATLDEHVRVVTQVSSHQLFVPADQDAAYVVPAVVQRLDEPPEHLWESVASSR